MKKIFLVVLGLVSFNLFSLDQLSREEWKKIPQTYGRKPNEVLLYATRINNGELAKMALKSGAYNYREAFEIAKGEGHAELVQILLPFIAHYKAHYAIKSGDLTSFIEAIQDGAIITEEDFIDAAKWTRIDILKYLLSHGFRIDNDTGKRAVVGILDSADYKIISPEQALQTIEFLFESGAPNDNLIAFREPRNLTNLDIAFIDLSLYYIEEGIMRENASLLSPGSRAMNIIQNAPITNWKFKKLIKLLAMPKSRRFQCEAVYPALKIMARRIAYRFLKSKFNELAYNFPDSELYIMQPIFLNEFVNQSFPNIDFDAEFDCDGEEDITFRKLLLTALYATSAEDTVMQESDTAGPANDSA